MIVVVTGTGTEVGKTYVTAAVARALRARGHAVSARKPAQSYEPGAEPTDAAVLAAATGEPETHVCPAARRYPVAMAPPMAAESLGLAPFAIDDLVSEMHASDGAVVLVEGAGGVRSPLASDGDTASLADALAAAAPGLELVVLVADAGLGTINLVRLGVEALGRHRVVVYLNHFDAADELHRRNRDWLTTRDGLEVVTDPEALASLLAERANR